MQPVRDRTQLSRFNIHVKQRIQSLFWAQKSDTKIKRERENSECLTTTVHKNSESTAIKKRNPRLLSYAYRKLQYIALLSWAQVASSCLISLIFLIRCVWVWERCVSGCVSRCLSDWICVCFLTVSMSLDVVQLMNRIDTPYKNYYTQTDEW